MGRGHDPQTVAHFVNRLVFCMFADDVGLLPDHMFTRMLRHAQTAPAQFSELAGELFRVMAFGGRVGFETVAWFNGGLFDNADALPLERSDIEMVLAASDLDWSEVDPSILGTLFERGLDPDKRAQLGAHYTDRDKIMLLVEPVVIRPLLAEWAAEKTEIAAELDRAEAAKTSATRTKRRNEAGRRYRAFLNRLRGFTVLDPACGSGNFLYLALQALKDLEHRVQLEAEADLGFQRAFPEVGPANVKGICPPRRAGLPRPRSARTRAAPTPGPSAGSAAGSSTTAAWPRTWPSCSRRAAPPRAPRWPSPPRGCAPSSRAIRTRPARPPGACWPGSGGGARTAAAISLRANPTRAARQLRRRHRRQSVRRTLDHHALDLVDGDRVGRPDAHRPPVLFRRATRKSRAVTVACG